MTLADLYAAVRAAHHKTIRDKRPDYDRGKAEGRVIGVALAIDTIRQETRR